MQSCSGLTCIWTPTKLKNAKKTCCNPTGSKIYLSTPAPRIRPQIEMSTRPQTPGAPANSSSASSELAVQNWSNTAACSRLGLGPWLQLRKQTVRTLLTSPCAIVWFETCAGQDDATTLSPKCVPHVMAQTRLDHDGLAS